jgi:hypothetical protein
MIEQMIAMIQLLDDDELITATAKLYKHVYDKMVEVGFTPEQALQLTIAAKFSAEG